jgi:hypothetical protein
MASTTVGSFVRPQSLAPVSKKIRQKANGMPLSVKEQTTITRAAGKKTELPFVGIELVSRLPTEYVGAKAKDVDFRAFVSPKERFE